MIALVIGGSGSGKSAYAEQMAVKAAGNGSLYYVATMQVYDEEGKKKVERHQKMRAGKGFLTIEQPRRLKEAAKKELESQNEPVSYTHLTLPTILLV